MDYTTLIIGILSTLSAGGWFVNYRQKKKLEEANAVKGEAEADKAKTESDSEKVDLVDKIMEKYQKTILTNMNFNSEKHDQQHVQILNELSLITEYLNGEFVAFKEKKTTTKKVYKNKSNDNQ